MKKSMTIEGRKYISSSEASEITGYNNDYIGQLCRGQKLKAKLVGRSWFIEEESLGQYQKKVTERLEELKIEKRNQSNKIMGLNKFSKEKALSVEKVPTKSSVDNSTTTTPTSSYPALNWKIDYSADERALLPELNKRQTSGSLNTPSLDGHKKSKITSNQIFSKYHKESSRLVLALVLLMGTFAMSASAYVGPSGLGEIATNIKNTVHAVVNNSLDNTKLFSATALSLTWPDFYSAKEIILGSTIRPLSKSIVSLKNDIHFDLPNISLPENKLSLKPIVSMAAQSLNSSKDFVSDISRNFGNSIVALKPDLHFKLPRIGLPEIKIPENVIPEVSLVASVSDWFDSSKLWVSNFFVSLFGSSKTELVESVSTTTSLIAQNQNIQKPIEPPSLSLGNNAKPSATVVRPSNDSSSVSRVIERIVNQPQTTIVNVTDPSITDRLSAIENQISSGLLVSRPFLSRQSDSLSDSAGRSISKLGDRVDVLESATSSSSSSSVDTSVANTWTALQQFSNSSSTLASIYNALYVGTTATTTILGTATSTFGAGIETTYLNITGTTATSTFARGIDLAGGCFAINGVCIGGGGSSQWTTTGSDIYYTTGNVGVGTTSPYAALSVVGEVVGRNFTATSTIASIFPYASTTAISASSLTSGRLTYASTGGFLTDSSGLTFDGTTFTTSYASTTALTSSGSAYFATEGGNVGIGTTSPYAKLSVVGEVVGNYFTSTSTTATSTFAAGIRATYLDITGTTATSTFARGIDLAGGCFAINGVCIGGGGSSQWTTTGSDIYYTTGNVGVGTTSPYAALSVVGEVVGRNFTATSTTATSTFAGGFSTNSGALVSDFSTGITSISSLQTGNLSFDTDAGLVSWTNLPVTSASADTPQGYTAFLDDNPMLTIYGQSNGNGSIKKTAVGIGTSTPFALLSIQNNAFAASSTYSFLVSSTTAGFATTTQFAITNSGNVGIGTTSPWKTLSVNGTAAFTGLTNDGTGYYVCLNTTSYELSTSTTACGASSERFKEDVQTLSYGLDTIKKLNPVSFDWKAGFVPTSTRQIGFIAEEVATIIPEIVGYDPEGQIMNLDYPKLTAVLVNAIQEQQVQIDALYGNASSTKATSTPSSSSNLITQIISSSNYNDYNLVSSLEIISSKIDELDLKLNLSASSTASTTDYVESESFIAKITQVFQELIQSTGNWVVQKITATLAIFNRIETQTAAISNGLEVTDSVTGDIWCMRISNGDWQKTLGSCEIENSLSTSTAESITDHVNTDSNIPETSDLDLVITPSHSEETVTSTATSTDQPDVVATTTLSESEINTSFSTSTDTVVEKSEQVATSTVTTIVDNVNFDTEKLKDNVIDNVPSTDIKPDLVEESVPEVVLDEGSETTVSQVDDVVVAQPETPPAPAEPNNP